VGGLSAESVISWNLVKEREISVLPYWRSPVAMVCDFTNEAREHVAVALSLLGTENEKKVKALGVTMLPHTPFGKLLQLIFTPREKKMTMRASSDGSRIFSFILGETNIVLHPYFITRKELDVINRIRKCVSNAILGNAERGKEEMKQLLCSLIEREPLKMEDVGKKDVADFALSVEETLDYLPQVKVGDKSDRPISSDDLILQLLCDDRFNMSSEAKKVSVSSLYCVSAPPFTVHVLAVGSSSGSKISLSDAVGQTIKWFKGAAGKGSQSLLEFTSLQTSEERKFVHTHCKGKVEHVSYDCKEEGTRTTMISLNRDFLKLIKKAGGIKKFAQSNGFAGTETEQGQDEDEDEDEVE